jgi:uncharacterized protein YdaU (DUF1376 family)
VGKTDIWMPVFIGDYLADTMHLSTEQHGAYLLLLFHLWRRGQLPDDDVALAQITGLAGKAWSLQRAVLAEFFEIREGQWQHGRVERERSRIAAKQQTNSNKAKLAATSRWDTAPKDACSIAHAMPGDADSESQSESESELTTSILRAKRSVDARHTRFRGILAEYWRTKNHASPEMPWQGRDAKALSDFLAASPQLNEAQFRVMLGNRARSAVAHGDRVYLWIANLTRFQEEITVYNKPASAGGDHGSRAEINRNSVFNAVDGALALARAHADRAGQAGAKPTAFADPGMSSADGAGPKRCAVGVAGSGDRGMAAGDAAHGQAGTDGSLPYSAATAGASGAYPAGRHEPFAEIGPGSATNHRR